MLSSNPAILHLCHAHSGIGIGTIAHKDTFPDHIRVHKNADDPFSSFIIACTQLYLTPSDKINALHRIIFLKDHLTPFAETKNRLLHNLLLLLMRKSGKEKNILLKGLPLPVPFNRVSCVLILHRYPRFFLTVHSVHSKKFPCRFFNTY